MKSFLDTLATHNLVEEHEKAVEEGKREHEPVSSNAWAHTEGTTVLREKGLASNTTS